MHTGRAPYESEDRGMQKIASKPPEAKGEHGTEFLLHPSETTNPVNTLIMNF